MKKMAKSEIVTLMRVFYATSRAKRETLLHSVFNPFINRREISLCIVRTVYSSIHSLVRLFV